MSFIPAGSLALNRNAENLARISLEIGAIKLRPQKPFQWASGYMMPVYNDNRMLLGKSEHRKLISDGFYEIIQAYNILPDFIAGTSTAGIPHATTLADRMKLPLVYVRDKPKEHGMRNRIEGIDAERDLEGREGLLIEDLVSTGGSSVSAVQALRDANGNLNTCLSIFSYGFKEAEEMFAGNRPYDKEENELNTPCGIISLLNYDTLLRVGVETGKIKEDQVRLLEEWRADPWNWGANHGFPKVEKKK
ncbi:MAG: orotate phosphoribosyltransferase [Nanoarchaeota archaeon]